MSENGQREKKRTVDTLSQFVKWQGHRISKLKGSMDTKTIYVFKYSDAAASMSTIHDKYDVVSTAKTPSQQRSYHWAWISHKVILHTQELRSQDSKSLIITCQCCILFHKR